MLQTAASGPSSWVKSKSIAYHLANCAVAPAGADNKQNSVQLALDQGLTYQGSAAQLASQLPRLLDFQNLRPKAGEKEDTTTRPREVCRVRGLRVRRATAKPKTKFSRALAPPGEQAVDLTTAELNVSKRRCFTQRLNPGGTRALQRNDSLQALPLTKCGADDVWIRDLCEDGDVEPNARPSPDGCTAAEAPGSSQGSALKVLSWNAQGYVNLMRAFSGGYLAAFDVLLTQEPNLSKHNRCEIAKCAEFRGYHAFFHSGRRQ